MMGLLMLNQINNLSDERFVEAWRQNTYYQAFFCQQRFTWQLQCDLSEQTSCRSRIDEDGLRKIFGVSVTLHGNKAKKEEVAMDSTVQNKNITFPTYAKLSTKSVTRCRLLAKKVGVKFRRRYQREVENLPRIIHFKSKSHKQGETQSSTKCLRTIAGIMIREMKRKLSQEALEVHQQSLNLSDSVQRQQRSGSYKIYSLHEPSVLDISKGKAHKKYEFGANASLTITKTSGIIVGALSFHVTPFDEHTIPAVLTQVESIDDQRPTMAICDSGYRGKRLIGATRIEIPDTGKGPKIENEKRKAKERFGCRVVIEPIIGHLKRDHGMMRSCLKDQIGDSVDLLMTCAVFNFREFFRLLYFFVPQIAVAHFSTQCTTGTGLCLTNRFNSFSRLSN